jgi:hypothetical protein
VRDQQSDRGEGADRGRRERRVGKRSLEQKSCDLGVGGSDTFDFSRDREDSVLNTLDNLGDTSLDATGVSDLGNGGTGFTDDNTGFLGRDEGSDGEGVFLGSTTLERSLLGSFGRDGFCIGVTKVDASK